MKVLFLAWRDVRHPEAGGSERYVQSVAEQLVTRGHDVMIRCALPAGLPRREDIAGVRHTRAGGRLTVYLRGLARAAREPRSTVVVDVVNGLPFAAGLLPRRPAVALIHHVHRAQWQLIYPGVAGRLGWFVESRITPWAYRRHEVITVSQSSRRDLLELGYPAAAVHVVRNGVVRSDAQGRAVRPEDPRRLVVLTRLVPHKQVEHALLTVAALAPEFSGLRLDVVGDGWWRTVLADQASGLGIDDVVEFHGHVDEATKGSILQGSALMLMPSAKEGWCLAVSEAGLRGVPTIGYRTSGGLEESIRDGETGWLVDDLDDLIRTTRAALRAPCEVARRGQAAKQYAMSLDKAAPAVEFEAVLARELSGRRR